MKRILSTLVLTGAVVAALGVPHEAKADSFFFGFGTPTPHVVYTQPRVVYVKPRPVYYQPAPVYYTPQVRYVTYYPNRNTHNWDRRRWDHHDRDHDRDWDNNRNHR